MRGAIRSAAVLLFLLAHGGPVHAYVGLVAGVPGGAPEFGNCEASELLEPATGNLFVITQHVGGELRSILNGGTLVTGCQGWAGGFYDCPLDPFPPPPPPQDTAWVVLPAYPPNEDPTIHRGWVLVDSTAGDVANLQVNVTQALRPISAVPAAPSGSGSIVAFSFRFHAVVEFGRDQPGSNATCRIGGDPADTTYAERIIDGYNIYRLRCPGLPSGFTPDHYLLGPDLAPGTGDEGWVAFLPSGTGAGGDGLDLSDPAGPSWRNDNDLWDAYGIHGLDWDGDTIVGPEDEAILIYSDNPNIATNPPPSLGCYSYVFQPVLKWSDGVACPGGYTECVVSDVTGDGVDDAVDLDGDTRPEFIDPSAHGLGLTADLDGGRTILICAEEGADGGGTTPAAEAVRLEGSYDRRTRALVLQLTTSLEADLTGLHVYRVGRTGGLSRVNDALIPAGGASLSTFELSDPGAIRAVVGSDGIEYMVETVGLDGSTKMHGPFAIVLEGAAAAHAARARR
jgi:hypothetical protein